MTDTSDQEPPHTVIPRLVLVDTAAAIDFYATAFDATEISRFAMPDGSIAHAEIRIGDSVVFLGDESGTDVQAAPSSVGGMVTSVLALSVPDVDSSWQRALDAGCEVIFPLADQFYGDRAGRLRDPFGHQWMLSTHIEDVDDEELDRRAGEWSNAQG